MIVFKVLTSQKLKKNIVKSANSWLYKHNFYVLVGFVEGAIKSFISTSNKQEHTCCLLYIAIPHRVSIQIIGLLVQYVPRDEVTV